MSLPCAGEFDHQSVKLSSYGWVVPSAYTMVPEPDAVPLLAAPTMPSVGPVPETATVCPLATTLSGVPGAMPGQVKVVPPWVTSSPPAAVPGWPRPGPVPSSSARRRPGCRPTDSRRR